MNYLIAAVLLAVLLGTAVRIDRRRARRLAADAAAQQAAAAQRPRPIAPPRRGGAP